MISILDEGLPRTWACRGCPSFNFVKIRIGKLSCLHVSRMPPAWLPIPQRRVTSAFSDCRTYGQVMSPEIDAEGWYLDPYGLHEQRWFSSGKPSRLVRDGQVESNDPPPDRPFDGPLSPAPAGRAIDGGCDLRRADEAEFADPNAFYDAAMNGTSEIFRPT